LALTLEIGTDAGRFPAAGKPKPVTDPVTADGPWELMAPADKTIINRIFVNYGKALQAYFRKLVSREAPFDAWMAGDSAALSASELRGAALFAGEAGCIDCHSGPHFSDEGFHDIGVPQTGPNVPATDDGRFKDLPALLTSTLNVNGAFSDKTDTGKLDGLTNPPPDAFKGVFRTPSLRGVALSAPYMHSGQLSTLADVVDFYSVGDATGKLTPLNLSPAQKADLVAFLGSLTGKPVSAALLVDTAAP
jgi:cytochrome c peroxidase